MDDGEPGREPRDMLVLPGGPLLSWLAVLLRTIGRPLRYLAAGAFFFRSSNQGRKSLSIMLGYPM
jgi:hypothetical protein